MDKELKKQYRKMLTKQGRRTLKEVELLSEQYFDWAAAKGLESITLFAEAKGGVRNRIQAQAIARRFSIKTVSDIEYT